MKKKGFFDRFIQPVLNGIEKTGNKLPQPVTLFAILMAIVLVLSFIASLFGLSAIRPGTGDTVYAVNLLNREGIRMIFTQMVGVFTAFPPLGIVLVVMLGIGVAERSGLISATLKALISRIPKQLVTFSLITAGMLSSLAVDAGYVVLIPLGAVIFMGVGKHPIAGLAAAFAGVSGGFSANLVLTALDPLLAGFTQSAAHLVDTEYIVNPTANYYLMIVTVPVFAILGTIVSEKVVEPMLGKYQAEGKIQNDVEPLTSLEKRGVIGAAIAFIITLVAVSFLVVPENAPLRDPETGLLPFYQSIVPIMLFVFFIPGLVYGIITKTVRTDKDIADMTSDTMGTMGAYIVLAFVAAQFVAYFNWSNLGVILAISGAGFLENIGFTGIPLIVFFVILAGFINLFIGSASAKWAILAPIFVPMLMYMGYSPEMAQAAYRMGDSITNILTPLLPYFPLVIIFAQKYQKDIGLGTLISVMFPFSIAFFIGSVLLIIVWMIFGLPLGPDAPIQYQILGGTSQ